MANRFVDTEIWEKLWFRKLTPEMKCVWKFLTDRCDHAGLWEVDEASFKFYIGVEITVDQIFQVEAFKTRFVLINDKIFSPGFITYQYKGELNSANRTHKSVIDRLRKLNIDFSQFQTIKPLLQNIKPLPEPSQGSKDKDTDKDIDNYLSPEIAKQQIQHLFETIYPVKEGGALGVAALLPQILTETDLSKLELAINRYVRKIKFLKIDIKFVKHFHTFALCWTDFLIEAAPKVQNQPPVEVREFSQTPFEDLPLDETTKLILQKISSRRTLSNKEDGNGHGESVG